MFRSKTFAMLYLIIPTLMFSQKMLPTDEEKLSEKTIYLTFSSHFDDALNLTEQILSDNPSSLKWKYLHAMVLFRHAQYSGSYLQSLNGTNDNSKAKSILDKSFSELQEVVRIGDKTIVNNPNDTLALFYTGAAYGYVGMYYAGNDEIFKASSEGKKGIDYHDRLINLCPRWNDVYYSRGVFNFYTSAVPWYLKPILWILGKLGSESKAEEYLTKVSKWGYFAKYPAMEMLRDLYRRQKKYDMVMKLTEELMQELPENRFMYLLQAIWYSDDSDFSMKACRRGIEMAQNVKLTETNKKEVGHFYLSLANLLDRKEDHYGAIKVLYELIDSQIVPAFDSYAHLRLGDIYLILGKQKEAMENFSWVNTNSKIDKHKKLANEEVQKLNSK